MSERKSPLRGAGEKQCPEGRTKGWLEQKGTGTFREKGEDTADFARTDRKAQAK